LGTVAYEVLTGIGPRVPRVVDDLARAERRRGLAAVKP
jgi:hypothetical protein